MAPEFSPELYPVDIVKLPARLHESSGMILSVGYNHLHVSESRIAEHVKGEPLYRLDTEKYGTSIAKFPAYFTADQLEIVDRRENIREYVHHVWLGDRIQTSKETGIVKHLNVAGMGDIDIYATNINAFGDARYAEAEEKMGSIARAISWNTKDRMSYRQQIADLLQIPQTRLPDQVEPTQEYEMPEIKIHQISSAVSQLDAWKSLESTLELVKNAHSFSFKSGQGYNNFQVVERRNSSLTPV